MHTAYCDMNVPFWIKNHFADPVVQSTVELSEIRESDILPARHHGYVPGERNGACKSYSGCLSSTDRFHFKATNPAIFKTSSVGICEGNALRTTTKVETPMAGMALNKGPSSTPGDWDAFSFTNNDRGMWLKKEGDKVSPGEVLCEVETDKATVEMECMDEGYLAKILCEDGAKEIKVGEHFDGSFVMSNEEDITKFKDYEPSKSGASPAAKGPSDSAPPKEEKVEEPVTLSEPKVTISSIKGTGPDGRIVKADIEDYLASRGKEVSKGAPKVDTGAAASLDYTDIPHTQIRKVTASRLLLSKQTIPHYYLTVDTCVDKLMELRGQLNSLQEASGGKRISINDLVIKAAALALRKVPQCNSSWTNDYIRQFNNVNINVAVQTDNGLFVPVIRDADKKGLSKISNEVKILAQKAKENSLKPEDYEGGTFTVSNLGGPFGIKQFCAIINPPQSGILAVGSAEKRVIPGSGSGQYKFASFMSVTLSCDHRVIDGASARYGSSE
ncbi:dihydrolipoamide acetyltransferase, long form protein [Actinidia rufa]|uniref:Dihydrolipoamide acetyltransferase component of pyruvate dehydrogenase complex n=1 Tax=Actinidia rufa TaxID=165716 RepID=A0A7J0G0C7_9ERIC|nr:dihydrolipoamide acetyltransferase, long form protein [Actinidia rufa]